MAVPRPSALINTMSAATNDRLTSTTMAAALVMIRPERSRPRATAVVLSAPSMCASCTRDSKNTS